jgi:hypothetical protein
LNEADGEEAGAATGFVDLLEGIIGGEPGNLNPLCFQALPGVKIGWKLLEERDDAITGLPIEAEGEGGDAFRGIFEERDFGGVGMDEARGGGAETFVDGKPAVIMEAAIVEAVVSEVLESIGAGPGEGRDGRVIEIGQVAGNRELIGIALPEWEFRYGTFYDFTTHSLYNTLIMA